MPAELLSKGKLTTATDVYSFGMLMWELMKSCRVLHGVSMGQVRSCCRLLSCCRIARLVLCELLCSASPACAAWLLHCVISLCR